MARPPKSGAIQLTHLPAATQLPMEEAVAGCVSAIRRFGFCVLDDVIRGDQVNLVCEEVR